MRSHVLIPDISAPGRGIHGIGQEPLGMKNHMAQAHRDIELQPHSCVRGFVRSSLEVKRRTFPRVKHHPPVIALLLVVF